VRHFPRVQVRRFEIDLHFGTAVVEAVQFEAELFDERDVKGKLDHSTSAAPNKRSPLYLSSLQAVIAAGPW
jgi:hypothetical protein